MRARHRNVENQQPFVRMASMPNDCARIQDVINERFTVDFEPFDAKALLNHKFREEDQTKWKNTRGFHKTMKAAELKPSDKCSATL